MRPDYLADVRVGKLHIERLKNFVRASGTCTKEELSRATTKFALISLASMSPSPLKLSTMVRPSGL